jgi:hypothetical protein
VHYHPKSQFRYFFHRPSRLLTNLDLLDSSLSGPAESIYAIATDTISPIPEGWEQTFNPDVSGWRSSDWKPGRFFIDHNSRILTPTDPRTMTTMPLNKERVQPWRGGFYGNTLYFEINIICLFRQRSHFRRHTGRIFGHTHVTIPYIQRPWYDSFVTMADV